MEEEDDKLIARVYSEHWKALHSKNETDRNEVLDWIRKKKLGLIADAMRKDGSARANGARAILDFIANLGKK